MDNIGDLSAIWQIVLNDIRDESSMPQTAIDLWFGKFKMVSLSTDKVVFASDSEMKRGIIQDKYSEFLADHVYRVIGFRPEVQIVVDPSLSPITHKMRQIRAGEAVSAPTFQVNEPDFIFVGNEMDDDDDDYYDEQDNITSDPLLIEEKIISDHLAEQGGRSVIHSTEKRLTFNPDYTFENFIVGSSNSLVHQAGAPSA